MKIALERSKTNIYDRIVLELAEGFRRFGHDCVFVDPEHVQTADQLLRAYSECDWAVITNSAGLLSLWGNDGYYFEKIDAPVAFLHHDAPCNTRELEAIRSKVDAYIRAKGKSIHFSMEKPDEIDLNRAGITCYPIQHINTLGAVDAKFPECSRDIGFLGHVVPPINVPVRFETEWDGAFFKSYLSRIVRPDHPVKDDFSALCPESAASEVLDAGTLSLKLQYIQYVNFFSMFQRGAVLQHINAHTVDVYGGDPAWLHGVEQSRFLEGPHIRYHPPVFDIGEVCEVFSTTKINLNISSLQFDSGVINRVLDCAAAGGFILTDRKAQLNELTGVAEAISYGSLDELNGKIDYFLSASHETERRELARQLSDDLAQSCSLNRSIGFMLEKMAEFSARTSPSAPALATDLASC